MQLIVDGDIIRLYQLLKVLMNVKSHRMPLHLPAWGYGCFAAGLFMFCSRTVTGTKVDLFKLFLFIFVVPCGSPRKFPISEWRWEIQWGPSRVNRGTRDGGQEPALSWGVAGQHCPRLPSTVIDIVPSDSILWSSLSTVHLVLYPILLCRFLTLRRNSLFSSQLQAETRLSLFS